MPRIAEQHLPGGWRSTGANAHTPRDAWPADCLVQWGSKGLVFAQGARTTAFFEAFPQEPATFIRGEGATVAEAEEAAFAKWHRILACPGHDFERRTWRNGSGACRHCDLFNSRAFEPLERCTVCQCPTYYSLGVDAGGQQHWYCEAHAPERDRHLQPSALDRLLEEDANDNASAP